MIKDKSKYWIGVDFDRTLSTWGKYDDDLSEVGEPILPMLNRVKRWLKEGKIVKIFTARASHGKPQTVLIQDWCEKHGLGRLEVTNVKCPNCRAIWDDKAVRVKENTGEIDNNFQE